MVSTRVAGMVLATLLAGFLLLSGRVAYLQTLGRERTILQAERQQHQTESLHARRGSIFDRNGLLMAGTIQKRSLFIDPRFMHEVFQEDGKSLLDLDRAVARLAAVLDRDPLELSQLIGDRSTSRYVKVAEHLDDSVVQAIAKLNLPGVLLEPVDVREYPMGSLAAHVLGGVRSDNVGLDGAELQFERLLRGRDGLKRSLKDARRRSIATAAEDYVPPVHGTHVLLSIDSNLQLIAEQELRATCEHYRARSGEAVVMDPRTGEVLALANYPTFNPANIEDTLSTPDVRRNRAVADQYEPGSTIKPFIVGPILAAGQAQPADRFPLGGPYRSPLRAKLVTDVHYYGELSLWDVLVKSSNVGMVKLAERVGPRALHGSIASFGFGRQTGIDLPGEAEGLLYPLRRWTKPSPVSVAMGYEMMLTPIQLARAFCAFANGGKLVTPRVLHGTLAADGELASAGEANTRHGGSPTTQPKQVIDTKAAGQVRRILGDVVVRGTGQKARSDRWNLFGKTGTAHSARGGSYNEANYTVSFVGAGPYEDPRVVVAVIVHDPDKSIAHFGGEVSAPAAGAILERSLAYLRVPASPPLPAPPAAVAAGLHNYDPRVYDRKRNPAPASHQASTRD